MLISHMMEISETINSHIPFFRSPAGPSARPQRHGAVAPGGGAGAPGRGSAAAAAGRRQRPGESPRDDAAAPGGVEWTPSDGRNGGGSLPKKKWKNKDWLKSSGLKLCKEQFLGHFFFFGVFCMGFLLMFLFGPSQKGHVDVVKLLLDEPWMVSLGPLGFGKTGQWGVWNSETAAKLMNLSCWHMAMFDTQRAANEISISLGFGWLSSWVAVGVGLLMFHRSQKNDVFSCSKHLGIPKMRETTYSSWTTHGDGSCVFLVLLDRNQHGIMIPTDKTWYWMSWMHANNDCQSCRHIDVLDLAMDWYLQLKSYMIEGDMNPDLGSLDTDIYVTLG